MEVEPDFSDLYIYSISISEQYQPPPAPCGPGLGVSSADISNFWCKSTIELLNYARRRALHGISSEAEENV